MRRPVKRGRQTDDGHVGPRHRQPVPLVEIAVRAESGHGSGRGCREGLEDRAACRSPSADIVAFGFDVTNLYHELSWRGMVSEATDGLADLLERERGHGLHRFRSDGVEPPCRLAADGDGAGAPAALRAPSDRHRRRRHRHDRRSQRQVAGAQAALARAARRERRRHQAAARAVSRLRRRARTRRASSTTRTGWRRSICSGSCATPASTSPSTTCCRRSR